MAFKLDLHRELTQVTTYEDSSLGIMRWGMSNSFPQTLKNLCQQSPSAKAAIKRTSTFFKGGKFEGDDQIIHRTGITLRDLVDSCSIEYAMFGGFSFNVGYNLKFETSSIMPLSVTDIRLKTLDSVYHSAKLGYHPNFGYNNNVKRTVSETVTRERIKWFDRFNPNQAQAQIEQAGKLRKWNGQILYYSNEGKSEYPVPPLQAPINFVLADIENSILVRKETTTGFINSYLLKSTLSCDDPNLKALEQAIASAQGARGTGKVITLSGLSPEEISGSILEEIGTGANGTSTIIDAATKGYELCRSVISGAYLIPPILVGVDQKSGFTSSELEDAYYVFNAITQEGRDIIEAEINKVLKVSKFAVKEIKLNKLTLDKKEQNV